MSNTALLFLVLFLSGLGLAFCKHPIYGLWAYMLVFYESPGTAWWTADIPDLRWSLLAAAVTMVAAMLHPSPKSRPPWYTKGTARCLIAFALWLWVQTPWALSVDEQVFMASLFSKYVLFYALLYTTVSDPKHIRQFFLAHIVGCFLWGFMAYLDPGSGRLENIGTGDVAGSNFASMHLTTGVAFAGFVFLGLSGISRWIAFAALPFMLNAIILMATRGSFMGIIASIPTSLFFAPKSQRIVVTVCLSLAVILFLHLAHDLFWSRMATLTVTETDTMETSAHSRIDIARYNLQMFRDYPWGVGHRGNEILSPRYMPSNLMTSNSRGSVRAAHNTLLAILVDHGFVGLILMLLFHASIARSLIRLTSFARSSLPRELRTYRAALGTALVIYWVNAQFSNSTKAEVVVWIAALTGALEWLASTPAYPDVPESEASALVRADRTS